MKNKELRDKNKEELTVLLAEKRETVRSLRFDIATKQVKNHRDYRNARKDIARIMTLLSADVAGKSELNN